MSELGKRIKKYRLSKKDKNGKALNLLNLSLQIGWENPSTLSRIESGEYIPERDTIVRIGKALNLESDEINALLEISGYGLVFPKITASYKDKLIKAIEPQWSNQNSPVILIQDTPPEIIYWNEYAKLVFMGTKDIPNIEETKFRYASHMDVIFDPAYGIKENVVNWDEFADFLVNNMYYWYNMNQFNKSVEKSVKGWMKYEDLKARWDKMSMEKISIPSSQKEFIYKIPNFKTVEFLINTSLLYQDPRFYVEVFTPRSDKDQKALEELFKEK